MTFDSRPDTYKHILTVQTNLARVIIDLMKRQAVHDQSKLYSPEVEAFDEYSPKLAELTYGSDEYRATLRAMKPAVEHHYKANSHHPEFYESGVVGMSLLDLIEMLCDWKAAGERHADNKGLAASIAMNQQRFGYSDDVKAILLNTVGVLEGIR